MAADWVADDTGCLPAVGRGLVFTDSTGVGVGDLAVLPGAPPPDPVTCAHPPPDPGRRNAAPESDPTRPGPAEYAVLSGCLGRAGGVAY
ncbi:hypothetical protein Scel_38530 [Streptomyces cellostaticus]|nr:hypothetical protein Scel_38530 [Streptomyces cellostaticus]